MNPGNLQLPMVNFSELSRSSPFSGSRLCKAAWGSALGISVTSGPYAVHHHLGHGTPLWGVWGKEDKEEAVRTRWSWVPGASVRRRHPTCSCSSRPLSHGEQMVGTLWSRLDPCSPLPASGLHRLSGSSTGWALDPGSVGSQALESPGWIQNCPPRTGWFDKQENFGTRLDFCWKYFISTIRVFGFFVFFFCLFLLVFILGTIKS